MVLSLLLAILTLSSSANRPGELPPDVDIAGSWEGRLVVPGGSLTIVFNFTKTDKGYIGTLDSPDQGASGIPLGSVSLDGSELTVAVPSVAGSYRGTVSTNGTLIAGSWTQSGQTLPLTLEKQLVDERHESSASDSSADLVGAWHGVLQAGVVELRIVVHFTDDAGSLSGSMDSPDQGATGIPVESISAQADAVTFKVPSVGGSFTGSRPNANTIDGKWSQGGQSLPLSLERSDEPIKKPARPQEPTEPVPYDRIDVQFDNESAGIHLSGTLTLPRTSGPHPAAILLSGSGPQDRDESLMGHKPFLVLADHLTRAGVAVLRFDDRGVGESGGDFTSATIDDFATDAESAFSYLTGRADIDPLKVGFVGHSEGGAVAPIVATSHDDVAFLVLMAGPGVPGYDIITRQSDLISRAMGRTENDIRQDLKDQSELLAIVMAPGPELDDVRANVRRYLQEKVDSMTDQERATAGLSDEAIDMQVRSLVSPWMRHFLTHDPRPVLELVTCPVLAINGENDLQVAPDQNLPAIREALSNAGNERVVVTELPGLNHLFQHSETGSPQEYGRIEETIAPAALNTISDWIIRTVGN